MFSWFKRRGDGDSIYDLKERLIYKFYDGQKMVEADPLVIYKRVMENGPELSAALKGARSEWKGAADCYNELVVGIRKVFDVKPFEEGGLTQQETFDLLDHFMRFSERLKKNSRQSPTSPTEASPPTPPSPEGVPPTSSSTGTGSTGPEPPTGGPGPSSTGPQPPSES